jgi:hypothetical protein
MLPYSREEGKFQTLKRSLAVYRMVFGQPRQEDLLAHLRRALEGGASLEELECWRISLTPP